MELSLNSDLELRQQDELDSIASIYGDIFTDITPKELVWNKKPCPHFQIALSSQEDPDRPEVCITLDIEFTKTYPLSPPLVKLLNPQNLLKSRQLSLEQRISQLIQEYPNQEVSFTIISEIKFMLDEFQLKTEVILSLEEERELRLRQEREKLEKEEELKEQELILQQEEEDRQLNEQIQKIQDEYIDSDTDTDVTEASIADIPVPESRGDYFIFENPITDNIPLLRAFSFKAVTLHEKYVSKDLFSSISEQWIVEPYLRRDVKSKLQEREISIRYLLTEITLMGSFWIKDDGKREIQTLEKELQQLVTVVHPNIARLYGFQLDKVKNKGWKVHLLTEFCSSAVNLESKLSLESSIDWALARSWLIQLLPAMEHLHNLGIVHKFICPLSLYLFNVDESDYYNDPRKTLKLVYPTYGFRLMSLFYNQSNKSPKVYSENSFLYIAMAKDWISPEIQKSPKGHQRKTDVWDLGVLFTRLMFGNSIFDKFPTPLEFTTSFDPDRYPKYKEYCSDVFDLLSKMLQPKLSKRPTPLELNAFKFLRDGPVIPQRENRDSIDMSGDDSPLYNNDKQTIGRYERDFEEIGRLGKGGFGEVVKARNRMEGTYYAIKKIKHKTHKLDSLLKEVLSLARLNHQYIVRYYGTWVEDVPEDEQMSSSTSVTDTFETEDDDIASPLNRPISSFMSSHDNSYQVDFISNSFDPNISFAPLSEEEDEEDNFEFGSYSNSTMEESQATQESAKRRPVPKNSNKLAILYIQMEFCENNTLLNLIEQGLPKNSNEYWRLFRQMLEAVSYIHSEGFIHRDLKPTNIFIDKSNNIKVGDFGLAKNSQFSSAISTNNQVAPRDKDLSTVVGTFFYTAKEVASGSYDEKVDMYSLGIMFFEMCFPLRTGMERAHTLNDLRLASIKFPSEFNDVKYKLEKRIIGLLLGHDPKKRPSATELLQSGWMPVEHQDQIIKEALKSLADPASPWQQQVRDTLFNQSYSLARDLMFDGGSKNSHKQQLDYSIKDHLLFNNMITQLYQIFRKHGAIEAFNTDTLIPKSPIYARETVYEVLDRSGAVLSLPYDLLLPFARFLSRNRVTIPKLFRHDFVYRPNVRGPGTPDKFGVVSFDILRSDSQYLTFNDAECLKVIDDVLESFPCFQIKGSTCAIIVNHYDILDAVIAFSFGNVGIDEKTKFEIMGILSQLGIDGGPEEIKRYLREDYKVPNTVTNDLIDMFNFTIEPEKAKAKLQKIFVDSPLLIRVERAIMYITNVLSILKSFGVNTTIYFNPLINYNSKYYNRGLMFQAVYKVDKSRKYSRIATGGRYDSFISSLANTGLSKTARNHAVGFSLSTTYLFLMLKNFEKQKPSLNQGRWKRARCDVLVTSLNKELLSECGNEILRALWDSDISADIFLSASQDDYIDKAHNEGVNWIISIRSSTRGKLKKNSVKYKSIRVRDMVRNKDRDVDSEEVVDFIKRAVRDRNFELENEKNPIRETQFEAPADELVLGQSQLFSVDINPKTVVVANEAPRGRKIKRDKWEVENDSIIATANLVKSLASSSVVSADVSDEVLDAIASTSIQQQDVWLRKVFAAGNNVPKSFALNILNALTKEAAKGLRWVVIYSSKTNNTNIVDLQR